MNNRTIQNWLDTATAGIRFKPDREAVAEELRGHLEDKTADLQRFYHISQEEAEKLTLERMGDAEEIGKELAKIHKPWLGYLWRASQIVLVACLAAAVWYNVASLHDAVETERSHAEFLEARGQKNQHIMELFFLDGIDPIGTYQVHRVKGDPLSCELVALLDGTEQVKAAHYRIRVARAALWDFAMPDGRESRSLFCDLRAMGLPWEPMGPMVLRYVSATDSLGNHYQSNAQYLKQASEDGRSPMGINVALDDSPLDATPFEQMFSFEVREVHPQAEWVRLEYELEDVSWSLTIDLKEGQT